jgi:hypothetical protein
VCMLGEIVLGVSGKLALGRITVLGIGNGNGDEERL